MPDKVISKVPVHVQPFKFVNRVKPGEDIPNLDYESTICIKPVAKVVDGKPGATVPDFSDQVSVASLIDSYKNETGLAYAMRQINQGRLMPNQLADKGTGSADISEVADNVNDAFRDALEKSSDAKKVANALDLSNIDQKRIDDIVATAVKQKFDAYVASQTKEVNKDE